MYQPVFHKKQKCQNCPIGLTFPLHVIRVSSVHLFVFYFRITEPKLKEGIDLAKLHLDSIRSNVGTFIDVGQVLSYGPFLYTSIKEVSLVLILHCLSFVSG